VGAGGNVGTAAMAKARPDGYTVLITADSAQVINPFLYASTGFDPVKDFEPVAPLARAGLRAGGPPRLRRTPWPNWWRWPRPRPGKHAIASAGNSTLEPPSSAEMLQKAADIKLLHVPYRGSAAAATDVVGGQVPLSVQSMPSAIGFIRSGKLKVLGVVNEKRLPVPGTPASARRSRALGPRPGTACSLPQEHRAR
jgi:tripartite-type tricarboxylate transporter receptor subunit TctC